MRFKNGVVPIWFTMLMDVFITYLDISLHVQASDHFVIDKSIYHSLQECQIGKNLRNSSQNQFFETFKKYQKHKNLMVFLDRSGIKTIYFCI